MANESKPADTQNPQAEEAAVEVKLPDVTTDRVSLVVCSKCSCEIDVEDLEPFVRVECPDCSHIETVPAKLGPFLLLNVIGTGGMGGVYYAKDESLGRNVAIKVMLKSIGENKEFVEKFKREAQAIARLNHPNIVQVYSFGEEKGQPFIVMELVTGQRFDKMVESKKQLDQAFVMRIGLDIAEGLRAADEAGLLHGDIKPENILLDEKLRAKLVDFGIATFANQGGSDGIWGTPYYIAPEKIRRQKVDCRSDIYSLGATLYHALTGHPPFEGKTPIDVVKARLHHPPAPLQTQRADIKPQVETLVLRMLESDQTKRYPNYTSLISDLRRVVQELGQPGAVSGFAADVNRRTGKVFSPKKRTAAATGMADSYPDTPPPQPTRLVIHKKGSGPTLPTGSTGTHQTKSISASTHHSTSRGTKPPTKEQLSRRRRALWTTVGILLTLLFVGSGIGITVAVKNKKNADIANRREQYALDIARKKADEIYRKSLNSTSNLNVLVTKAHVFINAATNATSVISGEVMDPAPFLSPPMPILLPEPTPEVSSPIPTVTASNAPAASTNTPASTNAPIEPKKLIEPTLTPPEPPKPVLPDADSKDVRQVATRILMQAGKITNNARSAHELIAASYTARNEAVTAKSSTIANGKIEILTANQTKIEALETEARDGLQDIEKVSNRIADLLRIYTASQIEKRKTEEEEAKRKAEEETKRQKEEAHSKLVTAEMAQLEPAKQASAPLIKQLRYKEVIDTLTAQMVTCQTEEGKAAYKVLVDRYTRLQSLRQFIAERLTAQPFNWGWVINANVSIDVLSADDKGVKIRGKDNPIPWGEVSAAQMMKFVSHYLDDPKSSLPVRSQGEQNLNAAIFCYENGGLKAVRRFVDRATGFIPDLENEAKRLVPME